MQLTPSGSGEPDCPDGTFAAGYTMDAWERWRIVCLAALSVEDIDIYLFGTMITCLLLIGLGFALGYRKIQKTGTAVQSLTRLPVLIEAVGRAVSIETETINRNMDSIKEKLTALQRKIYLIGDQMDKMDRESSLKNWNVLTRPKDKTILSFSGSPTQWPWQGCCWNLPRECNAVRRSCSPPPHPTDITDIAPPPTTRLRSLWTASLSSGSDQRRISGCGIRWLLAGPDSLPLWLCRVSMVYVLLCCWGVFPVLTLYSPRSIVWGLFFSPHFPHVNAVFFFNSTCISLLIILCMIVYVTNDKEPWTLITLNLGIMFNSISNLSIIFPMFVEQPLSTLEMLLN